MKKLILIVCLFAIATSVMAQSFWVKPKKTIAKTWCLTDMLSQEVLFCDSVVTYQNFNPLLDLTDQSLDLKLEGKNGINVYTVYKTKKSAQEQYIWGLSSKEKETQILTDYRLANLEAGKVMNFVDFNPGNIHINNFVDHTSISENSILKLGGSTMRKDLPIQPNTSNLAELIALVKPLSPLGKNILETGLALQYSITLSPSVDYILTPQQGVLWDAEKNRDFQYNIAGIARKDDLFLNQKQSMSTIEKGHLAIGYGKIQETNIENKSVLSLENSLIWGDDDKLLEFYTSNEGVSVLERQWLVENSGFQAEDRFELQLNEELILDKLQEDHLLWLKIRNDAESKIYTSRNTNQFHDVSFFRDAQTIEFISAPQSWIDLEITEANCEKNIAASLDLSVIGVELPYQLKLFSIADNHLVYEDTPTTKENMIDGLEAGKYSLHVIKNNAVVISQEINVTDTSIPELRIPKNYVLDEKDPNIIDASYGITGEWQYEWLTPKGITIYNSVIELDEPGTYWLKIFNNDCFSYARFHVDIISDNIKSALVYPNPSPNGLFHFDLELKDAYGTEMYVTDVSGRILLRKAYTPSIFIEDHFQLYGNGFYFITFTSGSSILTKKLVVQLP